jgi:hypothetical protein
MFFGLRKSIRPKPEASACGCETVIPITIKVRLFIQPEVLGMPPICHQQIPSPTPEPHVTPVLMQSNLMQQSRNYSAVESEGVEEQESDREQFSANSPELEIDISSTQVDAITTPVETMESVTSKAQTRQPFWAGLKRFISHTVSGAYQAVVKHDDV